MINFALKWVSIKHMHIVPRWFKSRCSTLQPAAEACCWSPAASWPSPDETTELLKVFTVCETPQSVLRLRVWVGNSKVKLCVFMTDQSFKPHPRWWSLLLPPPPSECQGRQYAERHAHRPLQLHFIDKPPRSFSLIILILLLITGLEQRNLLFNVL